MHILCTKLYIMKMKTHPRWSFFLISQRETNKRAKQEKKMKLKNPDRLVLITFWCLHKNNRLWRKTSKYDCISTTAVAGKLIASNAHTDTHTSAWQTCYNCIIKNRLKCVITANWNFRILLPFAVCVWIFHFAALFQQFPQPSHANKWQILFNFTSFRNRKHN